MAKQHFYSRVPAKVSMYNRSDGFDTFAHSEGLEREFIERELSSVYENKLWKNDTEAVRKGEMPVVYSQCRLRSGRVSQTSISYLSLDYTGERSSYLSHTLILSDDERMKLFYNKDNAMFNPDMFVTDISDFDFVSSNASPDDTYPEKKYITRPLADSAALIRKYGVEPIKGFIYAVLSVLCAKGKNIYFKLPCSDAEASAAALELMCSIITVIPYHLRDGLSFVTYVTDPAQYPTAKVKCLSEHCQEVHSSKGVFFDFHTGLISGLPADAVVEQTPVSFFLSLLDNKAIRDEFLAFTDNVVKIIPNLEKMNLKTLSDLVFLFLGTCGLFPSQTVLPNDTKIYDFFCVYEKYRKALNEEYRRTAYKCLERYPLRHEAIPKNIFAKLQKLYPGEVHSAKRYAMNIVLDLIHTDIMRDKLFSFIRSNYNGEDASIKAVINADLCRVYYGGFLQTQILSFFFEHFDTEPEETQNLIFDKLLLTVRTDSVQSKILTFLDEHYDTLSLHQKQRLYEMMFEMLPEGDNLSRLLVALFNKTAEKEDEETKKRLRSGLTKLLQSDSKRKEPRLLPLFYTCGGLCEETLLGLIFGEWYKRKIFDDYIQLLSSLTVQEKTKKIAHIVEQISFSDCLLVQKVVSCIAVLFSERKGDTLYDYLESAQIAETRITSRNCEIGSAVCKAISIAVDRRLYDVFDIRLHSNGMPLLEKYVEKNKNVFTSEKYKVILLFKELVDSIELSKRKTAFHCLSLLPQDVALRFTMSEYLKGILSEGRWQDVGQTVLCWICMNFLRTGKPLSATLYSDSKKLAYKSGNVLPRDNTEKNSGCIAFGEILDVLSVAYATNTSLSTAIHEDKSMLSTQLAAFHADYGKKPNKWIADRLQNAPADFSHFVIHQSNLIKLQKKGFLFKLFGK